MDCNNSLKKNTKLFAFTIKLQSLWALFILLFFLSITVAFSQRMEYKVKGRVLDENGKPLSKVDIRVSPIKHTMEENALTDENGRFSITKNPEKGDTWYLYVTHSFTSKYG